MAVPLRSRPPTSKYPSRPPIRRQFSRINTDLSSENEPEPPLPDTKNPLPEEIRRLISHEEQTQPSGTLPGGANPPAPAQLPIPETNEPKQQENEDQSQQEQRQRNPRFQNPITAIRAQKKRNRLLKPLIKEETGLSRSVRSYGSVSKTLSVVLWILRVIVITGCVITLPLFFITIPALISGYFAISFPIKRARSIILDKKEKKEKALAENRKKQQAILNNNT